MKNNDRYLRESYIYDNVLRLLPSVELWGIGKDQDFEIDSYADTYEFKKALAKRYIDFITGERTIGGESDLKLVKVINTLDKVYRLVWH